LEYVDLFLRTSGRASFNDPIHNLDMDRPNARLLDLLGVRYLVGHPYDRRLTTLPQTVQPAAPRTEVSAWGAIKPEGPVTHWLFVSLLDGALKVPLGEEVARLNVEAQEARSVSRCAMGSSPLT